MDTSLLLTLAQTLFPFVISPGASFVLTLSASTAGEPFAALRAFAAEGKRPFHDLARRQKPVVGMVNPPKSEKID